MYAAPYSGDPLTDSTPASPIRSLWFITGGILLAMLVGIAASALTPVTWRSRCRVSLRSTGSALLILKSTQLMRNACMDADVPPAAVSVNTRPVEASSAIELEVTSGQPSYAQRVADALPSTYNAESRHRRTAQLNMILGAADLQESLAADRAATAQSDLQKLERSHAPTDAVAAARVRATSALDAAAADQKELERLRAQNRGPLLDELMVVEPATAAVKVPVISGARVLLLLAVGLALGLIAAVLDRASMAKSAVRRSGLRAPKGGSVS